MTLNKLPEGWEIAKIKDVVSHTKGKKPKNLCKCSGKGLVPYIDIKAFEKGEFRQFADETSSNITSENDVLIVWDGARSGLPGIGKKGAIGSTILALHPIEISTHFLFSFIQSKFEYINSNPRGTGIPHVDPTIFWELDFPIAPFSEQQRIVAKLEKLMVKVEQCKARLEKIPSILKRFRQSVLAAACSGEFTKDWRAGNKNVNNPKLSEKENIKNTKGLDNIELQLYESRTRFPIDWDFKAITSLLSKERKGMKTGPFGTALKKNEHREEGVPVLGIENIGYLKFKEGSKIHITKEKAEELSSYEIVPGDIIISRSGTVGELCVVPNNIGEARFSTNIIRLAVNKKAVSPLFVCFLFQGCQYVLDQISELCKGSTRDFLNQSILKAISIPIPAISEQKEIVRRVEYLFKIADQIEARYEKAKAHVDKLTQSVLAKAFRGELVPQNPNDEPTSKLLERIREEREKRRAKGKPKRKHKKRARSQKEKATKFLK